MAALLILGGGPALAEAPYVFEHEPARYALVIGNANYKTLQDVPSAKKDAAIMAAKFKALGFDVTHLDDVATLREFEYDILSKFAKKIKEGDIVVFYFSGHGFAHGPHNFVAPTSMPVDIHQDDVSDNAISIGSLEDYFTDLKPGLILFVLDACRTIPGFKIKDALDQDIVPKSYVLPNSRSRVVNTLIAYATKPGKVAGGSANPEELSRFTSGLANHIHKPAVAFDSLFDDVATEVLVATNDAQAPGIYDWSQTTLYFLPDQTIRNAEKQVWLTALSANDRRRVQYFSRRFSLSLYAAAARKWLRDKPRLAQAPGLTMSSPVAIDRAWRPLSGQIAVQRTMLPLAFDRTVHFDAAGPIGQLTNAQLGHVPSGSAPAPLAGEFAAFAMGGAGATMVERIQDSPTVFNAHGGAITTETVKAYQTPDPMTAESFALPKQTRLDVVSYSVNAGGTLWVNAEITGTHQSVYVPIERVQSPAPLELGKSLHQFIARPRPGGIPELVDADAVADAVRRLKANKKAITWVSLATGKTDDMEETQRREFRAAHVTYLLKELGIDGRRITAVYNLPNFVSEGVRMRFYGYQEK